MDAPTDDWFTATATATAHKSPNSTSPTPHDCPPTGLQYDVLYQHDDLFQTILPRNLTWNPDFDFSLDQVHENCGQPQLNTPETVDMATSIPHATTSSCGAEHRSSTESSTDSDGQTIPNSLAEHSPRQSPVPRQARPRPACTAHQDGLGEIVPESSPALASSASHHEPLPSSPALASAFSDHAPLPSLPLLTSPPSNLEHAPTASEKEVAQAMEEVKSLEAKLAAARKQLNVAEAALHIDRLEVDGHR